MSFGVEYAQLVISGIASLSSVIAAWRNARALKRELTDQEVENAIISSSSSSSSSSHQSLSTMTLAASAQIVADTIPFPLLDAMRTNISNQLSRLTEALADPSNTSQAKDQEVLAAEAAICKELTRIMRLNRGHLPPDLQQHWDSFRCGC